MINKIIKLYHKMIKYIITKFLKSYPFPHHYSKRKLKKRTKSNDYFSLLEQEFSIMVKQEILGLIKKIWMTKIQFDKSNISAFPNKQESSNHCNHTIIYTAVPARKIKEA